MGFVMLQRSNFWSRLRALREAGGTGVRGNGGLGVSHLEPAGRLLRRT